MIVSSSSLDSCTHKRPHQHHNVSGGCRPHSTGSLVRPLEFAGREESCSLWVRIAMFTIGIHWHAWHYVGASVPQDFCNLMVSACFMCINSFCLLGLLLLVCPLFRPSCPTYASPLAFVPTRHWFLQQKLPVVTTVVAHEEGTCII